MVLTVPIGLWSGRNVNCKCTCFGRIESSLENVENWIFGAFESGQIFIWKVSDQNIIHKSILIQDSDASPIVSATSYAKNHLATLSLSGLIQFWNVPSGRVVFSIQARVGTDYLYWKSGRVGLSENLDFECRVGSGRVGDLVGRVVGIF